MAFNRGNPADLLALKTEVETDPISMGYTLNNVTQLIKTINDPADNVGGDTTGVVLTTGNLLTAMIPDDLDAQQVGDGERRYIEAFLGRDFNEIIEPYRAQIRNAFKTNSTTVANLDALIQPLSRAEVLFGEDTILVREDWFVARDS